MERARWQETCLVCAKHVLHVSRCILWRKNLFFVALHILPKVSWQVTQLQYCSDDTWKRHCTKHVFRVWLHYAFWKLPCVLSTAPSPSISKLSGLWSLSFWSDLLADFLLFFFFLLPVLLLFLSLDATLFLEDFFEDCLLSISCVGSRPSNAQDVNYASASSNKSAYSTNTLSCGERSFSQYNHIIW